MIEKENIISTTKNYNNTNVDRYVIAARGNINGIDSYTVVVIISYPSHGNIKQFYLHESITIEAEPHIMTATHNTDTVSGTASKDSISEISKKSTETRKNISGESVNDILFSKTAVTSEEDSRYLELAKDPEKNRDALQKMVDEAARKAMPDSKILDEDGNLLVVYHGSQEDFTVFDRTKSRSTMDIQ